MNINRKAASNDAVFFSHYNYAMVFSSFPFLWIFLPLVLLGTLLTRKRGSNLFLLAASLVFYAWGEPKYVLLLLFSITLNYLCGLMLERLKGTPYRGLMLATAIIINLALLGFFKYFNFFTGILSDIAGHELIAPRSIALPIGISFYTFQSISYIADLYRGTIEVQRSWIDLALYISFFPQLVAGPIVKYREIADALHGRVLSWDRAADGLRRFCFGLAKKVVIANTLGYTVDQILSHPIEELSTLLCWTAAVFYTLQIYFDFSGYSDMAIGLANTLGFTFRENFDFPYRSLSIREFWRRWHISLSTWFRDYLYIPLGGNRKGQVRTLLNLSLVFFATGLWHGAQWTFVVWGLYHGFFMILERLAAAKTTFRLPSWLSFLCAQLAVVCGWVFFRADDLGMALRQLQRMFIPYAGGNWSFGEMMNLATLLIFVIAVFAAWGGGRLIASKVKGIAAESLSSVWALICLALSVVLLANAAHNPFIYFRF